MEATPTLPPGFTGDPNMVSPGVLGFIVIFAIAALTVLLAIDMTRRIRRVRYRDEAQRKIEAGSYGICVGCGQLIDPARLRAFPLVTRCLEDQERFEMEEGTSLDEGQRRGIR